jgi:hypothetical protein
MYYFVEQGMHFRVKVTHRAASVERWIHSVQREFLDCAPENSKCIGMGYEYTDAVKNVKQRNLPSKKKQWTALLQLSM